MLLSSIFAVPMSLARSGGNVAFKRSSKRTPSPARSKNTSRMVARGAPKTFPAGFANQLGMRGRGNHKVQQAHVLQAAENPGARRPTPEQVKINKNKVDIASWAPKTRKIGFLSALGGRREHFWELVGRKGAPRDRQLVPEGPPRVPRGSPKSSKITRNLLRKLCFFQRRILIRFLMIFGDFWVFCNLENVDFA